MSLLARELVFQYSKTTPVIIDGWTMSIEPGEVVGFAGPSGYGKTTFAKLLAGYLRPTAGSVTADGLELPSRGHCPVQLIVQHPETAVDPRWRAREILAEGGDLNDELLADFGIRDEWLTRYPHEMSGGELQRLAIVRALAGPTRYLIADELSTMLDAESQALIWTALLRHTRRHEIGVLSISHNMALLDRIADGVIHVESMSKANI